MLEVQFNLPTLTRDGCQLAIKALAERGVEVKWFGHAKPHGFTSQQRHWRFVQSQDLPETDVVLQTLFDMRVPLSFSLEDCTLVARILCDVLTEFSYGVQVS